MKLLVGLDGSNAAKDALKVAIEHAKAFGAELLIVSSLIKGTDDEQEEIKKREDELDRAGRDVKASGLECTTHLLIRGLTPGEDLVNFADENGVDEIFIGVRRRSKVGKLLFGSTAQYVILNAKCPVVTVR